MTNDLVNICFVTDNNYVQHTLVAMASMLAHKYPTSCYKVYIICDKVDDERKDMMTSFESDGFEVDIVDYNNTLYAKKDYEQGKYISSATYIRLKLPSIFPDVDRMLYLDGDIIVQDDLSQLFFMDLEGNAMAGSPDFGVCVESIKWPNVEYIRQTLPNYESEYMNAGVLLLDLNELRKIGFERTCSRLYDERTDFIFADQDIINFALHGRKKLFPIYWNCPIFSFQLNYGRHTPEFLKQRVAKIYHVTYKKDLFELAYKSKIIHLNGNKKWIFDTAFLGTLYERYLKMAMEYAKGDLA